MPAHSHANLLPTMPPRTSQLRPTLLLLLAAATAAPPVSAFAQQPAPDSTPKAPALTFDVSTVKLNKSGSGNSGSGMKNGYFTATNVTLKNLMQYSAFGIPGPRIVGGPKWLDSERFDIEAKIDPAVADQLQKLGREEYKRQSQAMFQQLLSDRFKLTTHWETRELPVYNLVVAKGGQHLQPAKDPDRGPGTDSGNGQIGGTSVPVPDIARALTQEAAGELGRVVLDKTGIAGKYDFKLKWTPDTGTDTPPANSGPSLFTAIQEQLGLKLEPAKGPVEVLVIDRAEMPTEN